MGDRSASKRAPQPTQRLDFLSRPDAEPRLCRLFHRWGERPVEVAIESLGEALNLVRGRRGPPLIVAGAGFVRVRAPYSTRRRFPNAAEFASLTETARLAAVAVRRALPRVRPVVVFGVDVSALCSRSEVERTVGQFAAVLPGAGPTYLLPKRFPTPEEETYLRVPADADSPPPSCDTPFGQAAVLVCHDVNVYSPRGDVYQTRARWRCGLRGQVKALKPAFGLHLAHYVETSRSFLQAYNAWAEEVGVPLFGVSGVSSTIRVENARDLARSLLSGADGWGILDLCEFV